MDSQKANLVAVVSSALLALVYTAPFLMKLTYWGVRDWDLFTTMAAVPVDSILTYGQFPFWNMYLGGGNILFHHPEVLVLSPFLLLYLIFGAVVGLKLQVLICYFLGFWGSQRLGKVLGLSPLASLVLAVAYFGSIHFALHFAEGHMPFTHFCFTPWFLSLILADRPNFRTYLGAAGCLTLMILGNGAAIPLLYTLTVAALMSFVVSLQRHDLRVVSALVISAGLGMLLAAVKVVPMAIYLAQNTWEGNPHESIPVSALGAIFFGWDHSLFAQNFEGQMWAWHEYGAFVSPLLVLLAFLALYRRARRWWPWAIVAGFFLALGLGDFSSFSPWKLLSHLPGFSSARCTGRSFQMVILALAILGAVGLDLLRDRMSEFKTRSWARLVPLVVASLIMATNLFLVWPAMQSAFTQPSQSVHRNQEFQQVTDDILAYRNFLANRGSLVTPWLSAYHPSRGLVDASQRAHLDHVLDGQTQIVFRQFTPNEIVYRLQPASSGRLVIGMGYDPGWSATDGRPLTATQGLISFAFDEEDDQVILRYQTPFFWLGGLVSCLALLGSGWLFCRRS